VLLRPFLVRFLLAASLFYPLGCGKSAENPPVDRVAESAVTDLTEAEGNNPPIFDVIAARRSVRSFNDSPVTDEELARILWSGQGITDPGRGLRTAPSAGALYPIVLYVCDRSGVGRYEPKTESIVKLSELDVRDELTAASLGQSVVADAPVVIVVVAKPEVTAAKYGGRAERYCTLEAGHVAQNILLAAVALDLGAVTIGAFDDDSIRAVLSLEDSYIPLYLIPVGHPE
jgi:SagB-type dehydrogenase family enzyme